MLKVCSYALSEPTGNIWLLVLAAGDMSGTTPASQTNTETTKKDT